MDGRVRLRPCVHESLWGVDVFMGSSPPGRSTLFDPNNCINAVVGAIDQW